MFNNIGGKIKALAKLVCWIGIVCSVIAGMIMIANAVYVSALVLAIIFVLVGSLISWISSFTLYGFGQLIENTDRLVQNSQKTYADKAAQQMKKNTEDSQPQKDFLTKITETETADLELILQEQKNSFSEEELKIIENELSARKKWGSLKTSSFTGDRKN